MDELGIVLEKLAACVQAGAHDLSVESGGVEIKSVPATGGLWDSIHETVCAMLNTRGGTVILGVKDEAKPTPRFVFTGYDEKQGDKLITLRNAFKDRAGHPLEISEFVQFEARPFLGGQVAIILVNQLTTDLQYAFYKGVAYERVLDKDKEIPKPRLDGQEEIKRELEQRRELRPEPEIPVEELSLQRINELVMLINHGQTRPIETIKSSLDDARDFLLRRRFLNRDGQVTTLGALICAEHPEDELGFRCHLDAFADAPQTVAQDKKTFRDNILQVMEAGFNWTLRNIMTGVSIKNSGSMLAEYPEKLIRESINNALAHRDYSVNRPVQLTIKPGESLNIRNPGRLPPELLMDEPTVNPPVRRIFADPSPRNPRLAGILKLHNKWEGKGIGMADLTNAALENEINLPYYLFHRDAELTLCIPRGKVFDETMEAWLQLRDQWISNKTGNRKLTDEHRIVLAYLLKSERLNRIGRFTIALTENNNHANAISDLVAWGLITRHPELADARYHGKRIYIVARELADDDCHAELKTLFGHAFDELDEMARHTLNMVALAERYSSGGGLNAKQVSRLVAPLLPELLKKLGEDEFYRAARRAVEKISPSKKTHEATIKAGDWVREPDRMLSIKGPATKPTYRLNREFDRGLR